jgi:hypothetical protein
MGDKLLGQLITFLCVATMVLVGVYCLLGFMGKTVVSNTVLVSLVLFNLFTYIWYSEFYDKK